jgi:predicted Rossmann fold nucleotide-binding protein DprA/Smf involved in DNA uptake
MKITPITIKEQKPAMHALIDKKLRVLAILSDNLKNPHPQVVSIDLIAADLRLSLGETRQLLLKMDQEGEIMSDPDGRYSLITPTGLDRLDILRHCSGV